jgi:hypothetical protein
LWAGPPLLRHALRRAAEAGRNVPPRDKIVHMLRSQPDLDPNSLAAIIAAGAAAASAIATTAITPIRVDSRPAYVGEA